MRKFHSILGIMLTASLLTGCELKLEPSKIWDRFFDKETDSEYYEEKSEDLINKIAQDVEEYEITKVVVMDLVDDQGRVPVLGEYMANRVVEAITRRKFFRVAQRGEVVETLNKLSLQPSFLYTQEETKRIGHALNAEAIVNGTVRDIGSNIDVHIALVDIASGEVISSATEKLNRTKFAVELLHHF